MKIDYKMVTISGLFIFTKLLMFLVLMHFLLTVSEEHGIIFFIAFIVNFLTEFYLNIKMKGLP